MAERPIALDIGYIALPNDPDDRNVTCRSARSHPGVFNHHQQPLTTLGCLKTVLFATKFNILLLFIPLGILAEKLHWAPATVFTLNFIAIIPLAKRKWRTLF